MVETGQLTFALSNETGGWKIAGWAFSATVPHAAFARAAAAAAPSTKPTT